MRLTGVQYSGATLVIYLFYMTSRRTAAELQSLEDTEASILQSKRSPPRALSSLQNTISDLDSYLADYQKRTCRFGLNSHHCALSSMDHALNAGNWLNSAFSPGKRSQADQDPEMREKYERLLETILEQREHLAVLQSLLKDAENKVNSKSKRTCMFNLGGRCATELASAIADQYYYLNSANSPGRRRRHAPSPLNPN